MSQVRRLLAFYVSVGGYGYEDSNCHSQVDTMVNARLSADKIDTSFPVKFEPQFRSSKYLVLLNAITNPKLA